MRGTAVLSVLSMLSLAACASRKPISAVDHQTETVRVGGVGAQSTTVLATVATVAPGVAKILAPIDQVWRALPAVYDSLGIPVDRLEHDKHIIGNPGFELRRRLGGVALRRYLDCGQAQGGPSADTYEVTLSVLTELQPAEAGTTAATVVQATARPVTFAGERTTCKSTGEIERRVAELLGGMI